MATTIFAVVIGAAYALFDSSRTLASKAEMRAELFQTARAALRALEDDVRGAVLGGTAFDTGLIGTNRGSKEEPLDRLEVFAVNQHTQGNSKDKRIDLSKALYRIADGTTPGLKGLVRERVKTLTAGTTTRGRGENQEEVAPDVIGLDLRYYDSGWKDTWDSTTQNKLPKAVEATILVRGIWRDEPVVERFTTRFYLAVGAETPERQPQ